MAEKLSSVEKTLAILDCFNMERSELSLAQICRMLGTPKSTTLNQLHTLESMGYLFRSGPNLNYRLGYKIMELNYFVHSSQPIIRYASPILEELKDKCGANVYLTSHIDGKVFYVDCVYQNKRSIAWSNAGKMLPMHCTACGKAMLSYSPDDEVNAVLERWGMPPSTEHTITDKAKLFEELMLCRERGYAIDNEEESVGVRCVATAVRTSAGKVAGAVSVSGAAVHMSDDLVEEYARLLINASAELMQYAHLFPAIQLGDALADY